MTSSFAVFVIPVTGALFRTEIKRDRELDALQMLVGGMIEAVPIRGCYSLTSYVNEEGKFLCIDDAGNVEINRRATSLMGPSLFPDDFIAGQFVICGFDADTGENTDAPDDVVSQIIAGAMAA